jgi:hypothetical protein
MGPEVMQMKFQINGQETVVTPRQDESLLETLRERCGVTLDLFPWLLDALSVAVGPDDRIQGGRSQSSCV